MGASCSICFRSNEAYKPNHQLSDLKLLKPESMKLPRGDLPAYLASHQTSMPSKLLQLFAKVQDETAGQETAIDLRFTNLHTRGLMHFTKILPFFTNLKVLRLWKTGLGPEGLTTLKELIPLFRLEVLSLEDNHLGPQGAFILVSMFTHLKTLRELWLQINSIGHEGAAAMAEDLHMLRNLESLALDENDLCDSGAKPIMLAVASLPSLQSLSLSHNFLTKDCVREIIHRVKALPSALKLNLKGNLKDEEVSGFASDTQASILLK